METIKLLPDKFDGIGTQKGYVFSLHQRGKKSIIYSKSHKDTHEQIYEVIMRNVVDCINWEDKTLTGEKKESYPSDKMFGVSAWSFGKEEDAVNKFNELELKEK